MHTLHLISYSDPTLPSSHQALILDGKLLCAIGPDNNNELPLFERLIETLPATLATPLNRIDLPDPVDTSTWDTLIALYITPQPTTVADTTVGSYMVNWRMDIDPKYASTPQEAAQRALEHITRTDSEAHFFMVTDTVTDKQGVMSYVDLNMIPPDGVQEALAALDGHSDKDHDEALLLWKVEVFAFYPEDTGTATARYMVYRAAKTPDEAIELAMAFAHEELGGYLNYREYFEVTESPTQVDPEDFR